MATQQNYLSDYFSTTPKRYRELSTSNSDSGTPFTKSTKISRSPVDTGKVSFSSTVEPDSVMDNGNTINDTEHKSRWEQNLYEKMCAISGEITVRFERLEAKFNGLTQCNSFLEEEIKSVKKVAEDAQASQKHLNDIIEALSAENKSLKKKLVTSENYSKKQNLTFLGIPESQGEALHRLIDKFHRVLYILHIDPSACHIDNIHRLPSNARGHRPVIIKFVSMLERNLVWESINMLKEHFASVTESKHSHVISNLESSHEPKNECQTYTRQTQNVRFLDFSVLIN